MLCIWGSFACHSWRTSINKLQQQQQQLQQYGMVEENSLNYLLAARQLKYPLTAVRYINMRLLEEFYGMVWLMVGYFLCSQ